MKLDSRRLAVDIRAGYPDRERADELAEVCATPHG
jgi:hypothetical protein